MRVSASNRQRREKGALFNFISAVSFRVDSSLVAISTAFVFCKWLLTLAWRSANYRSPIVLPIRRRRPKPSTANKRQQNGGDGPHRQTAKQPAVCHGGQRSAAHPTPAPSATPGGPGRAMGGLGAGLRAHRQPHTATSSSLPCSGTNAFGYKWWRGVGWGGRVGGKSPPRAPGDPQVPSGVGWGARASRHGPTSLQFVQQSENLSHCERPLS